MTRILRKLSELKLISTNRSKNDQREMVVRMTAKGKRLVDAIGPRVELEYARIRQQLEPENLASLTTELKRLIDLGHASEVGVENVQVEMPETQAASQQATPART
jgi:DNA-binding MarR family transcriptional regulator